MSKITPITNFTIVLRHLFLNIKNGILYLKVGSFWWRSTTSGFQSYIKKLSFISRAGFASSVVLFIISLLIIFPVYYKANLAEAAGSLSDTTLSITSDNLTAGVDLLITSDSGTFASSTSPMSFNVSTNNSTGYMLSISAKSGTDLTNISAGTSFTSLDATNSTIAAGITADAFGNASNTAYNNQWGFKPSYYKSNANTDKFYPSPTTSGVTLNKTDSANTSGSADTYTVAIGARATYTQPAGTYTNTYILSATGNIALTHALSIANGSNISSSTGAGEYSIGEEVTVTATPTSNTTCLTYSAPTWTAKASDGGTATGYFKSTSSATATGTSVTYVMGSTDDILAVSSAETRNTYTITYNSNGGSGMMSNTTASCGVATALQTNTFARNGYKFLGWSTDSNATSATYIDSQSITLSQTSTLLLYAVWEEKIYMQSMDISQCTTTEQTVYDNRDEEAYIVRRLADDKCWLLDNLRLDLTNSAVKSNLSSTTTNATDIVLGYLKNGGGSSPYTSYAISNSWTSSSQNYYNRPMIATAYKTTTVRSAQSASTTYEVGIYYNYCAASAGSYCYTNDSSSGNTRYDICPSGWRLPTGGDDGEYQALYAKYNNFKNYATALHLPLSGEFYSGSSSSRGNSGSFWSSTRNDDDSMHFLSAYSSSVITEFSNMRNTGGSVRCVLKSTTIDAIYMQDVTNDMVAATADFGESILIDSRDSQTYTVKKINDQLWMTRNLAIGCNGSGLSYGSSTKSIQLVSNTSNVSTAWSTPTALLSTAANSSKTSGYTTAAMQCNDTYGAWYNIAAASAGTITGKSNNTNATHDICPTGWRLPTAPNTTSGTDFNKLIGNTTSGWQSPTNGLSNFGAISGGNYVNGLVSGEENGDWWSATAKNDTAWYLLDYNSEKTQFGGSVSANRYFGVYVRCVHD